MNHRLFTALFRLYHALVAFLETSPVTFNPNPANVDDDIGNSEAALGGISLLAGIGITDPATVAALTALSTAALVNGATGSPRSWRLRVCPTAPT